MTEWIVIKREINGRIDAGEWREDCYWDGIRHQNRNRAVEHGFATFRHDDFNIAEVDGDTLIWFGWMHEPLMDADEPLEDMADQLGLTCDRTRATSVGGASGGAR